MKSATTVLFLLLSIASCAHGNWRSHHHKWTDPPAPEPIEVIELPLPPVVSTDQPGSCSIDINPHGTGCIGRTTGLQAGNFLSDGNHILAAINFAGAPAAPDAASIYTGSHVIIIKADGSLFDNGDSWKCITCGVPVSQSVVGNQTNVDWSYPQAFYDGKRILAGTYIISCGSNDLVDDDCTPDQVSIYKVRLDSKADGSGAGLSLRELRLHPDNVHIGVNTFTLTAAGSIGEVAYYGKLEFNGRPTTGSSLFPRYDIVNASLLADRDGHAPVYTRGNEIFINNSAIAVGELRGFSGSGEEVTYIGYPTEACNIDVYAVHLTTGRVRRLTSDPGYCDPIEFAPDDNWFVIQDTRGSGRTDFMDGLKNMPPITDLVTSLACSSVRNNGARRFFQPWLLDRYGDRGSYIGQSLNNAHLGQYGSGGIDDPQWNGRADPWFSPDGTKIVYWQAQVVSPACGGTNPLPCYNSTEPQGRDARVMLAKLTSREPIESCGPPEPHSDIIPWAIPYVPGTAAPSLSQPAAGIYTLKGSVSGAAQVEIVDNDAKTAILAVNVQLTDYADEEGGVINGYQNISSLTTGYTVTTLDWYTNLTRTGTEAAKQFSSEDGFHMRIDVLVNLFEANGTLITETGGVTYRQPLNGA